MATEKLISDPELEVITIDDFSHGIVNASYNGGVYSTQAPIGSASNAFRCYNRQGIGLEPLPTYTTIFTKSYTPSLAFGLLTLGDIQVSGISSGPTPNIAENSVNLVWFKQSYNGTLTWSNACDIDQLLDNFTTVTNTNLYTRSGVNNRTSTYWPNIVQVFFNQAGILTSTTLTIDPTFGAGTQTWVLATNPATGTGNTTGTLGSWYAKMATITGRMVFMTQRVTAVGNGASIDEFFTSDIYADTNIVGNEFFFPEVLGAVGAWGSVSTGEFVVIGQQGGAVVINGDIQTPNSATLLPAVSGTGTAVCPATSTPIGMVYVNDSEGVWVWNGGNTSQKISNEIVDSQFLRTIPSLSKADPPSLGTSNIDTWMNWVLFPNNLMYDVLNQSWWRMEDTAVNNFQVWGARGITSRFIYSSPGIAETATTGVLNVPIMRWDHALPATSFRWISNPIPVLGALISLEAIEIVASNLSNVAATVKVTPTSPSGQALYPGNQNPTQSVTFTIPANTASFRGLQRLGYTDFNGCVQIDSAAALNTTNPAPTIHEINLGFSRRPSAVG